MTAVQIPFRPASSIAIGGGFTGGGVPVPKQIYTRIFDVADFGAVPMPVGSNPAVPIVTANDQAFADAMGVAVQKGGGILYVPGGIYFTSKDIAGWPLAPTNIAVIIRGDGMRSSYIYPTAQGQHGIRMGPAVPSLSGDFSQDIQYCGVEDLSVNGSLIPPGGTPKLISMVQAQFCWLKSVILEELDVVNGYGVHLLGSTGPNAPHCWRPYLERVVIANVRRPMVLENSDEGTYVHCNIGLKLGAAVGVIAIEWIQGRNHRWQSLLLSGDSGAARANYRGLVMRTPGVGNVLSGLIEGVVAEGFDVGLYFENGVQDFWAKQYSSSFNRAAFNNGSDNGTADNQRQNNVHIEMQGESLAAGIRSHHASVEPSAEYVNFADGDATPSVAATNTGIFGNTAPTNVTTFDDARFGQELVVRLDANTTLVHNVGLLRCPGAVNLVGAAHKVVTLRYVGLWYVTSVSQD